MQSGVPASTMRSAELGGIEDGDSGMIGNLRASGLKVDLRKLAPDN
jgi:hypothetical protein